MIFWLSGLLPVLDDFATRIETRSLERQQRRERDDYSEDEMTKLYEISGISEQTGNFE